MRRFDAIAVLAVSVLILGMPEIASAQDEPTTQPATQPATEATNQPATEAEAGPAAAEIAPLDIANAYGLEHWDEVEELRYTFNVKIGQRETTRKWTWRPHEDAITYEGETPEGEAITHTYSRAELPEDPEGFERQVDHWFINDQYWLLFPFRLVWDEGVTITNEGEVELPIGEGRAQKMVVQYGEEGGYTPGDKYELYVGDDRLIDAWSYTPAGSEQPRIVTTWDDHQELGPLTISMDHRDRAGLFRLWFTDVAVKTAGDEAAGGATD